MKILNLNKIKKFKARLYKSNVSGLFKQGTKGLNPLTKYKTDEKGRILVQVSRITKFFIDEITLTDFILADDYLAALYLFLQELSTEAEAVSFDCGVSVSLEDIQAADNKTVIKLLTTNIIVTYFNSLKTYKGTVDTSLLSLDLLELISKSSAGRDYTDLVKNILTSLSQSFNQDKPWRESLDEINDTDLICRLTRHRMPPMTKEAMACVLSKSRSEIKKSNELFTRIMVTRAQLVAKEENKKKYLKSMEKLDIAILTVLKRIDAYLEAAHRLMGILGISYHIVIGETHELLRQNLIWLFLNAKPGKGDRMDILKNLGLAQLRYRLNILFTYPNITLYARSFQDAKAYAPIYFDIFRLLFKAASEQLIKEDYVMDYIERALRTLARSGEALDLPEEELKDEKQSLQQAYVSLILKVDLERLDAVMNFCDPLCRATQDRTRKIMADIRPALITACYTGLCREAEKDQAGQGAVTVIKGYLSAYALHCKPQRDFYRIFFDTHICSGSQPALPMVQLIKSKKTFAAALLTAFADEPSMKKLISEDRISNAASLLKKIML